jgi:hypothetical protein
VCVVGFMKPTRRAAIAGITAALSQTPLPISARAPRFTASELIEQDTCEREHASRARTSGSVAMHVALTSVKDILSRGRVPLAQPAMSRNACRNECMSQCMAHLSC